MQLEHRYQVGSKQVDMEQTEWVCIMMIFYFFFYYPNKITKTNSTTYLLQTESDLQLCKLIIFGL